jgi:hypothetical protein
MPRVSKKTVKAALTFISKGSGITEGLELWFCPARNKFVLQEQGQKFKEDVTLWNEPNKPM